LGSTTDPAGGGRYSDPTNPYLDLNGPTSKGKEGEEEEGKEKEEREGGEAEGGRGYPTASILL